MVRTPLTRKNLDAAEQRIRRLEALLAKQQQEEEDEDKSGRRQQTIFDLPERSTRDGTSRPPASPRLVDSHDPTLSLGPPSQTPSAATFSPRQVSSGSSSSLPQGTAHQDGGTLHPDPPLFSPPAPVSLAPPVFNPAAPALPAARSDSAFPALTTPIAAPLGRLSHDLAARLELPPASTSSAETPVETEEDGMGSLTVEQGPHASSYLGESCPNVGPERLFALR